MELNDEHILLQGPLTLADVWVEMVMPSLSALLSNATRETLGHLSPVFGALGSHDVGEDAILLLGPGALGEVAAVIEFKPAGVAFDL